METELKPKPPRIVVYEAGRDTQLSENFTSGEFDCHCGCGQTKIDTLLVSQLQAMRNQCGKPIVITSGFRCPKYQQSLRDRGYATSDGISTHERGMAADIEIEGLNGIQIERLARSCGFESVGVGKKFCHVDTRDYKRRWFYS